MKFFNIKINIISIKNILKFLLLFLIIFLCIYILYLSSIKTFESFSESKDCNNCQVLPTSGNCIPLYDISNTTIYDSSQTILEYVRANNNLPDISFIDTSFIFCPYEPKCGPNDFSNILDIDDRLQLSNEEIFSGKGGFDINCCSDSDWFKLNADNFNSNNYVSTINDKCNTVNTNLSIALNQLNNDVTRRSIIDNDIVNIVPDSYFNFRSVCNTYRNIDSSGVIFKKIDVSNYHILNDPELLENDKQVSVQNLLDAQRFLTISMETINGERIRNQNIDDANNRLRRLNPLNPQFDNQFRSIQQELSEYYISANSNITNTKYNYEAYKPVSSTLQPILTSITNQRYILNEDEFITCNGDISNTQNFRLDISGSDYLDFLDELDRTTLFGVSEDATYSTQQDATSTNYGPSMDLAMEFRNLEQVNPGGTAPTGVIDQYLRAINGFYEKQMSNMLGPRTHTINQQLIFENDGLETKKSTFFVYENNPNNEYECQPSITGNDKFKNCGPPAYYSEFKP